MARVIVSKEARSDLVSIRDYIRDELLSPDAAQRILAELKKSISSLAHYPGRGKPLDALIAVHTEYRYLICEHYCVLSFISAWRRKYLSSVFYTSDRTVSGHCSCLNEFHGFTPGHTSSI